MDQIQQLLLYIPGLLLALCVHEFAHAWVAVREGDQTPLLAGRVTLDPRAHLDPIGSVLFPVIGFLSGAPLLGWAKPVMTNPRNYRDFRGGDLRVSLAGVAANLLLAVVLALVAAALWPFYADPSAGTLHLLAQVCVQAVVVNVGLMVFNLIPVPPLDGSRVLYHFLPAAAAARYRDLGRYGFLILYMLIFTGVLRLIGPVIIGIASTMIMVPAGLLHA